MIKILEDSQKNDSYLNFISYQADQRDKAFCFAKMISAYFSGDVQDLPRQPFFTK